MKYIICGFSGAGKTQKLSQIKDSGDYQGYQFIDLDDHIFETHKVFHKNLGELIEEKGWQWFRKTEDIVLFELLRKDKVWVSLGGGTLSDGICDKLSQQKDLKIFWLDATFEACWERIKNDPNRPMSALGQEKMYDLYRKRCLLYKNYPKLEI